MRINHVAAVTLLASSALLVPGRADAATAPNGPVAFECTNAQYYTDICVTDPATGSLVNLTNDDASDGWPSWSPGGAQIAFGSDYGIDIMNADGTGRRHLVGDFTTMALEPAWSPDGTRIAYVSFREGGGFELWTIEADGDPASITRLTSTAPIPDTRDKGVDDIQPTWSPDSSQIAFVSTSRTVEDACDVYAMAAVDADGDGNGDNLRRLTNDDSSNCSLTEDINPSWSPTGDLIAYSSVSSGDADIWVMDIDGGGQRNITNDPAWDWMPGWSPDGTQVTFTSGRDGDDEIYVQPVAAAAPATRTTGGNAQAAVGTASTSPARQLTFNDTPDRLSDWGSVAATQPAAFVTPQDSDTTPSSMIATPEHESSRRPHRRVFRGGATDDQGVAAVEIALVRRVAPGDSRWWNGTRFVRRATAPIWLRATGATSWSYTVGRRLPAPLGARSRYVLLSRAIDIAGQVETQHVRRVNKVPFWVDRRHRRWTSPGTQG